MSKEQRTAVDAQLRTAAFDTSRAPGELRAAFAAMMAGGPPPSGVTLTPAVLGGRPTLEITPEGQRADGTILYFHGGNWVVGSPATAQQLTAALVVRTGARAVSLDYRLAPEHPFPGAIEDAVAAYRDLLEHGIQAGRVVLAGDSAGGGLAVGWLPARPRPAST
jgi:acetyl esterase/lipase